MSDLHAKIMSIPITRDTTSLSYEFGHSEALRAAADVAQEEEARLTARVAELEGAMEWRPIATAPKDGTRILLGHPKWGAACSGIRTHIGWGPAYAYELAPFRIQPTHWRPLPPLPKEGE